METVKVIVIVSVTFILHCSFFPVVVCPLENLRSSPEGYPHANLSSFPFPSLLPPLPQLISPCTMCTPSGCCTGWGLIHLKKYISGSLYFSWLGYRSICSSTTTTLCHCLCLDDGDCLIVFALEKKNTSAFTLVFLSPSSPPTIFIASGYRGSMRTPLLVATLSTSSFSAARLISFPFRSATQSRKSNSTQHCCSFLQKRSCNSATGASMEEQKYANEKVREENQPNLKVLKDFRGRWSTPRCVCVCVCDHISLENTLVHTSTCNVLVSSYTPPSSRGLCCISVPLPVRSTLQTRSSPWRQKTCCRPSD